MYNTVVAIHDVAVQHGTGGPRSHLSKNRHAAEISVGRMAAVGTALWVRIPRRWCLRPVPGSLMGIVCRRGFQRVKGERSRRVRGNVWGPNFFHPLSTVVEGMMRSGQPPPDCACVGRDIAFPWWLVPPGFLATLFQTTSPVWATPRGG